MLLAIIFLAGSMVCDAASDQETKSKKSAFRDIMDKEAAQYQACSTDDDCTFFVGSFGFTVNKKGLNPVSRCALDIKQTMFRDCSYSPNFSSFEVDKIKVLPSNVVCNAGKCTALFDSKTSRDWAEINREYLIKYDQMPRRDSLCRNHIKSWKDSQLKK